MRQRIAKIFLGMAATALLCLAAPVLAHPMGNFSINHYARWTAGPNRLSLRYVLDFAEIPTVMERGAMGVTGDNPVSEANRQKYLTAKAAQWRNGLSLVVNNRSVPMDVKPEGLEFRPGAGGLPTLRITLNLVASLPADLRKSAMEVVYKDANYAERTGWKEIVAAAESGAQLSASSVPTADLSHELTVYPSDPTIAPPQTAEARFTIISTAGAAVLQNTPDKSSSTLAALSRPVSSPSPRTPQDAFTQAIAAKQQTPGLIVLSLGLAFLFGAFHALSPGHGKGMVAAYLVGTRGTVRHAIFLGGVVTLTHTIGVFALGLITLTAAQFIVPERLYPVLSALSGLAIVGIGAGMLWQRIAAKRRADEEGLREDAMEYDAGAGPPLPENAPVSFKSLLVLGITGGALPCPSALVVMLSAIALHRIAFGLALIGAFSLGLAAVLTGIGLLVVRLRNVVERMPFSGKFVARLPLFSAAVVTLVGLVLVFRAFSGQGF